MLLAGDIGGTKSTLALVSREAGAHHPLWQTTLPSRQFASLPDLVRAFLVQVGIPAQIDRVTLGIPGPIVDGSAAPANLPWRVEATAIGNQFGWAQVRLVNDLEALAHAIPFLRPADVEVLHAGTPLAHGNVAVVAPGTGLGEAFLTWEDGGYRAHASEGGHASFAPVDAAQVGLLEYLMRRKRYDHVSTERVCSGMYGIPNIYDYLRDAGADPEPAWLAARLNEADDRTPIIVAGATEPGEGSALCLATLRMFASILASEAGSFALKVMPAGGIYLGGGILPRVLPVLRERAFLARIRAKGRMRDALARIPVHVILNPHAALLGAAVLGLDSASGTP
jgi:glucokinase